jgi:MFS family permease
VSGNHREGPERPVSILAGLRNRWALVTFATTLYWMAAHALRPLVPLRLSELGASDLYIGVVFASYSALSLFLAIPGGRLIDRIGTGRVLAVAFSGMAAVGVGYALATTPAQLLVLMTLNGITETGAWLALQALITYAGRGEFRTRQLSLFSFGWGLGIAVGPAIGAAIFARAGFAPLGWFFALLALTALAGVAFVPFPRSQSQQARDRGETETPRPARIGELTARPAVRAVLLSSFVALFVNAIRMSFYPLYLERSGVSVERIGLLLSVMGVVSLLIRLPLPALLRRWGESKVLVWGLWSCVVPMALTPWLPSFWLLAVAAAVYGAAYGLNPPVTVQMMAKYTEPHERGLAMGLRITSNRLSQVAQPLLYGALATTIGMASAFPVSGVMLAGMTFWTQVESRRSARTAVRDG